MYDYVKSTRVFSLQLTSNTASQGGLQHHLAINIASSARLYIRGNRLWRQDKKRLALATMRRKHRRTHGQYDGLLGNRD